MVGDLVGKSYRALSLMHYLVVAASGGEVSSGKWYNYLTTWMPLFSATSTEPI